MAADAIALAALLAVAASEPPRASAAAGPRLEIRPALVTLGQGDRARVRVRSAGAPRIVSSVGVVGRAVEVEPGVFEADLEPPLEAHPQLALVAAIAPDGVAFACLPLVGRGVAVAHTEPGARITVRIRDREFGPAIADASGVALVPVEVPPGERYAYQRGRPLDLRVPPLKRVHVIASADVARADRDGTLSVYAFAATASGQPWAGAPIAMAPDVGTVDAPREVAPGAFVATWRLPPGTAAPATLEARAGEEAGTARATVARPPGPPARVSVRLDAYRAAAGAEPIGVVAEVTDAAGNGIDGEVRLDANAGTISAPEPGGRGVVRARYRPPERLDGRTEAAIVAAAGALSDRRSVALVPAGASAISVELESRALVADGAASSAVRVSVVDRFGNGVDDPPPAIHSRHGSVAPPSRDAPGRWTSRYEPGWVPRGGDDAVVVHAGSLTASAPVRLLEPPRRIAATLQVGVLHAFGGFTAPLVAGAVEAWPTWLRGLGVGVGLGRASSSRDEAIPVGDAAHAVQSSATLWPVDVTLLARHRLGARLTATAGAGAGAVAVRSDVALDGTRSAGEWGWAPGVHGGGGVALELPAWHARARLDLRLAWQGDTGMRSFRGGLGTLGIALGVTHDAL